jgi:hypothetical protein
MMLAGADFLLELSLARLAHDDDTGRCAPRVGLFR